MDGVLFTRVGLLFDIIGATFLAMELLGPEKLKKLDNFSKKQVSIFTNPLMLIKTSVEDYKKISKNPTQFVLLLLFILLLVIVSWRLSLTLMKIFAYLFSDWSMVIWYFSLLLEAWSSKIKVLLI